MKIEEEHACASRTHTQKKPLDMARPCATKTVITPLTNDTVQVDS